MTIVILLQEVISELFWSSCGFCSYRAVRGGEGDDGGICIDTKFSVPLWSHGIRSIRRNARVRISRKGGPGAGAEG